MGWCVGGGAGIWIALPPSFLALGVCLELHDFPLGRVLARCVF